MGSSRNSSMAVVLAPKPRETTALNLRPAAETPCGFADCAANAAPAAAAALFLNMFRRENDEAMVNSFAPVRIHRGEAQAKGSILSQMRIIATILLLAAPALYCQTDWPVYGHD